jgi:hypothetical protein
VKPVVALLACVLIIGACGDDDDTPKAADPARDASFVAAMHAQGLTYGEAAMVNVAHVFCDDVDNAHDVESFVAGAAGTGIATKDLAALMLGSVTTYCPEDRAALDEYTATH